MSFLYPVFLWASTAVLIPIAIHIFNLRSYKTVYFSNTAFLEKVKEQSKTRNQLKHLIVLLCRILAILALVFMFAQPQLGGSSVEKQEQTAQIGIYFDNSFSMEALSDKGMLLEAAKNRIHSIVAAHGLNTSFTLLTNDEELRHQEFVSSGQLLKYVREVQTSSAFVPMSKAVTLLEERFADRESKTIYLVSDFQKVSANVEALQPDTTLSLRIIQLNTQQMGNLYIDSVWFEQPSHLLDYDEELFVRIVNLSDESFENLPVTYKTNGNNRSVVNTNLAPNEIKNIRIQFTNKTKGSQLGEVEINDYPITFDNTYYFSYNVVDQIDVMLINDTDSNKYFTALNTAVPLLNMEQVPVSNVPVSQLASKDLVILNNVSSLSSGLQNIITKYVTDGGTLLFFPNLENIAQQNLFWEKLAQITIVSTDTVRTELHPETLNLPFFGESIQPTRENVLLPSFSNKLVCLPAQPANWNSLLWDRANKPLLQQTVVGSGTVYIASFSLSDAYTNFMEHPLFTATMLAIPIKSMRKEELSYTIGNAKHIEVKAAVNQREELLKLNHVNSNLSFIPPWYINPITQKLNLQEMNQISEAGHYLLTQANTQLAALGFNYDRRESDWASWTPEQLQELITVNGFKNIHIFNENNTSLLTSEIQNLHRGTNTWRYFLVFALLCIVSEVLVIRFIK